jgi:putative transcriptional regulator
MRSTAQRRGGAGKKVARGQRQDVMSDELFAELRESVREGAAILRGVREPSRAYEVSGGGSVVRSHGNVVGRPAPEGLSSTVNGIPNVGALRAHFQLSQAKFAALLGISPGTLRNWEQGRREPEGPARVLLRVAARYPEAVLSVVSETARARPRARKRTG